MIGTRSPWMLILAAVAGLGVAACRQSLFDANVGDDEADAGTTPGPDGDPGAPDADSFAPDADVTEPDSGATTDCLGDIVEDFASTQGGQDGRWRYREDNRALFGAYADMSYGPWSGVNAWVGTGGPPTPAIVSCPDSPTAGACAGMQDRVLLVPSASSMGLNDPAVEWTAPYGGVLSVQGSYRSADGASGPPLKILLSRNARHDLLFKDAFNPTATPDSFDFTVDVLEGDRLELAVTSSNTGTLVPLGIQLRYVDSGSFPGDCMFAARFETEPLMDECGGVMLNGLDYETDLPSTTAVPSVSAEFGMARHLEGAEYEPHDYIISTGGGMDYSGDFTIQFWARFDEPPFWQGTIYADWDCDAQGGVAIGPNDSTMYVGAFHKAPGTDACAAPVPHQFQASRPMDGGWHFYRLVRSTASQTLAMCIDGVQRGSVSVPAAADLTSGYAPRLGRVPYAPPYWTGDLDEVRIYKRALPCPTLP